MQPVLSQRTPWLPAITIEFFISPVYIHMFLSLCGSFVGHLCFASVIVAYLKNTNLKRQQYQKTRVSV